MKRFSLLILSFLLAQFCFAQDDEIMRIINLNTPTINIGGKNLKVGDQFSCKSTINWSNSNQVMECKGLTTRRLYVFSCQQFKSKGVVNTVKDYLLRLGQASTRGTNSLRPSFASGQNKSDFPEKRCALVIGNSNYSEIAFLRNPLRDADDISSKLMDYGFDVLTGYDCNFDQMMTLLNVFSSKAREYDVALIFYSGHGIQEKGANYLIPIDCPLIQKQDLDRCVAGTSVVEKLQETNCPTRILILDACREIHTGWTRSASSGLASMEGYPGMVITFSTRAGQTAEDGKGNNSPFAKAFLDNISGSVSFHDMMRSVANDTYKNTGSLQYPVVIGTLMTNFIFNPGSLPTQTATSGGMLQASSGRTQSSSSSNTRQSSSGGKAQANKQNTRSSYPPSGRTSDGSYIVTAAVVDENGIPLKGATVMEKGTSNTTSTDWNGAFSIKVPSSRSIIDIKCEGYEPISMSAMVVPEVVISKSTKKGNETMRNSASEQGSAPAAQPASPSSYVVSATLVDEEGAPLIAASVVEQGSDNTTLTDLDGDFKLRVSSSKSILVFSYKGFQTLSLSAMAVPRVVRLTSVESVQHNKSESSEQTVAVENKPSKPVVPKNSRINQSLASYYSFDNRDADDESGNNMDGIANGGVQFVEDTPSGMGYAARLNGYKKGFINIPYNVFAGKTNYSISLWIKDFDYGMIVTAISTDGPRADFPRLVATMGNRFRLFTCYDNWDSTERFDFDISNMKYSEWHHVVVTCAKTDSGYGTSATRQLYVDGRLVSVSKGNVHRYYNVHGYEEDIISKIQIGGDRNGAYDQCTSMIIDNVRFYTTAISKQTVQELFQLKM